MSIDQLNNYVPGQNLNNMASNVDYNSLGMEGTDISVSFTGSPATVTVAIGSMWELNGNRYSISTAAVSFSLASAAHNYITYNESTGFSSAATVGTWSAVKQGFYQADNITRTLHWYIEEATETVLRQQADTYRGDLIDIFNATEGLSAIYSINESLLGIAGGGGSVVTVGLNGQIALSGDSGETWVTQTGAGSTDLHALDYGAGVFCAVGAGGAIYTSSDGITWAGRTSGTAGDLHNVNFAGGYFFAGGTSTSGVLRSADGITWASVLSATIYSVAYNSDLLLYCAVGAAGVLYTSPDGTTWTVRSLGGVTADLLFVSASPTGFFTYGSLYAFFTSTDGLTWTRRGAEQTTASVTVAPYKVAKYKTLYLAGNLATKNGLGLSSFSGSPIIDNVFYGGYFFALSNNSQVSNLNGIIWRGRYIA